MTPPSPLAIAAGRPQTSPISGGHILGPDGSPISPGSPTIQTAPKSSTFDPRSQPPKDPLVELLKRPLDQMIGGQIRPSVANQKIWLNAQMRRSHYYWEGQQYLTLAPNQLNSTLTDYRPLSSTDPSLTVANANQGSFADYVLNIFRGDIRKFEAVIGTRAPNVQARTRDPNDESQTTIRRMADRVAAYLNSHWHTDFLHRELVHYLALYGNAFTFTRYVADKSRYGSSSLPLYTPIGIPQGEPTYHCLMCGQDAPQSQVQASGQRGGPQGSPQLPLCPRCANPLGPESLELAETIPGLHLTELMEYENGAVEIDLVTGAMVTYPFWIKSRGASVGHAPWWIYEYEIDKGQLCQTFPQLNSQILRTTYGLPLAGSDSTGLSSTQTRRVIESPMGTYNYVWSRDQWLYTRVWLPATTLAYLPNDPSGSIRQQIIDSHPTGILTHYCNGELIKVESGDLEHDWSAFKAEPSETIYSQPYFHDYIQGQDTINDMLNNLIEASERSTGAIIFDPQVLDPDRIREYATQPGEYIPAVSGSSGSLRDSFFTVPAAEVNIVLKEIIDTYISYLREISGIRPEIFGGGNAPTARQAEMNKNQALMQLNTVWNQIRTGWAKTFENAAHHIAIYARDGQLYQSRGQGQSPDLISIPGVRQLADGGWYYECEEAFPMSVGQRKDWFMNMLELAGQNPILQQDISSPANRSRMAEAIGSPDWRVSGVREREMILRYIHRLSKEKPIQLPPPPPLQPEPDPATGQLTEPPPPDPTPPPQPSQPFNWDLFTAPDPTSPIAMSPAFVMEVIREWATDDPGQELMDSDPQGGWANVMAFLAEAVQKATPPPDPPPPIKTSVAYSIKSADTPPDALEKVMEDRGLLPPNSPPFSSDPNLASPQSSFPPLGPGGPGEGKMGSDGPRLGGGAGTRPHRTKPPKPLPPSDPDQPSNALATNLAQGLAAPPPGQPSGPAPLHNLLPPNQ